LTPAARRPYPPARLSWLVWGLGAVLYFVAFFHRLAPAVLTRELMADFGIGAAALGNLSGFYFYSYWLMQVPTGILADTWGPRRLLTLGALGAAAGALIFGLATDARWAGAGRLLIGASVAVAFVVNLKLAAHWFPARYFSMISGVTLCAGTLGGIAAGVPLRILADRYGWRAVAAAAGAASAALAAAIWAVVRDDPAARGFRSHAGPAADAGAGGRALANLAAVLRCRNTWLLCFIPAGQVGAVLTFCGLWGVPYLTTHRGLTAAEAAALTTLMMICWSGATPFVGRLSDRIGRRKPPMLAGQLLSAAGWAAILYTGAMPAGLLALLAAATGVVSASFNICWPLIKESVPLRLAGTVTGVINMGIMLGPTLLQPAVGWMLDRRFDGAVEGGVRLYGLAAYRAGFALMIGWILCAAVLLLFARETHCRQAA
jgi:MFS family permease